MSLFNKIFGIKPKPGEPIEITDAQFEEEVLMSEIPVVVDFYSKTCAPCTIMRSLLTEIGPEYYEKVKIVKLNVTDNRTYLSTYRIASLPTLVFFSSGRPVDSVVGLLQLNPLKAKFHNLI
jgi:thioredoxin 1